MLIDTHCHLDFHQFDQDRDAVMARAIEAGVDILINPGTDLQSSQRAIALAERYPGVYAQVGIHPNESATWNAQAMVQLSELAAHPRVVAIGEIGLDYYWERVPHAQQWAALEAQLDLALDMDLPVVLHCRDAHEDLRDVLRKWVPIAQTRRQDGAILGVYHAYSGDVSMAEEAFGWNMALSIGGPVTFRNAHQLRATIARLPLQRIMLETDAPYLAPHPYRGQRNEPGYVPQIAHALASLWGTDDETVAAETTALARHTFRRLN